MFGTMGAFGLIGIFPLLLNLVDCLKIVQSPNLAPSKSFFQYFDDGPSPFLIRTQLDHTHQHGNVQVSNDVNNESIQSMKKKPFFNSSKRIFVNTFNTIPTTTFIPSPKEEDNNGFNPISAENNYEPIGRYGRYDTSPLEQLEEKPEGNSFHVSYDTPLHFSHHKKKPKKEVHYHQHKHVHEHDHKQDHKHQHEGLHAHNHGHDHKSNDHHQHQHTGFHQHKESGDHHHSHSHGHKHSHSGDHKHDHHNSHKHSHHHSGKHDHSHSHKHGHSHHSDHKHSHHQSHGHDHKHNHGHHGSHKHDHQRKSNHDHKHDHKHKHSKH